jgi:DUF177 domain-containing protein
MDQPDAMLLDLSRFRGDVDRIDRRFEPGAFSLKDEEFRLIAPVDLHVEVRKDAKKVRLVGHVRTILECDCCRCLEPFAVPVDSTFDLLFLPNGDRVTIGDGGEQELREDDVGVAYYQDDEIDLGEVMREQFYLVQPMKPLCREDCRGLCPVCGVNRNRETCDCKTDWVDPRMEPLRKLKDYA